MKSRGPVDFMLHIDHIENPAGDVWALQYKKRYFTLKSINCFVPLHTVFRGMDGPQPRAYLSGFGYIDVCETTQSATISYYDPRLVIR
jgi:hypothetical protein